jgi:hypothetical protein
MELDLFLAADAAASFEGKLYIHGGSITRLTPPFLPWAHPQLALVARFALEPKDYEAEQVLRFRLVRPDGQTGLDASSPVPSEPTPQLLEGEQGFKIAVITVAGIVFDQEGLYRIEVDIDGEMAGSIPLPLGVIPQPGFVAPSGEEGQTADEPNAGPSA